MRINNDYISLNFTSVNQGTLSVSNNVEKTFSDVVAVKSADSDKAKVRERTTAVLDSIGSQAPDEVKQAWREAEEETDGFFTVYGLWISNDGKQCHITKMMVDRFVRWFKGDVNQDDMLGNSVESAISAVEKWIYDVDHPLAGQSARSMEDQRLIKMEREFYERFLDKLMRLADQRA